MGLLDDWEADRERERTYRRYVNSLPVGSWQRQLHESPITNWERRHPNRGWQECPPCEACDSLARGWQVALGTGTMLIIDSATQTAVLKVRQDKESPVVRWEVWFQTPMGVVDDLATAIGMCTANDMPPQLVIRPVPVAIAEDDSYEVLPSNH